MTVFFTDGSSRNNGRVNCRAAYAVYCPEKNLSLTRPVLARQIRFEGRDIQVPGSNIRAEGFAILHVLQYISEHDASGDHTIVTDSQFWIDMIQRYIPSWLRNKKFSWDMKKNSDLCESLWNAYWPLHERVKFQFIRAHQTSPPSDPEAHALYLGNMEVDRLASEATATM